MTANEPYSTPHCASTAACVFPGGTIPASAISPIAANLLQNYIPLPNAGTNTFIPPSVVSKLTDDKAGQRVDFNNKKTGNWYGYYHFDDSTSAVPGTYGPDFGNFGTFTPGGRNRACWRTRASSALRPSTKRAWISRASHPSATSRPIPKVALTSLGFVTGPGTLGIINSGPDTWQSVPPISLSGQIGFSFGRTISATGQYNNTWHFADNFAKIWRKHAFKFGGDYRYLQINERNIYAPNGNFDFDGSETGHDVADFLLGAPDSYIQASFQVSTRARDTARRSRRTPGASTPNFTLNYGLRWEASMPWYDTQNKIQTIVPGVQSTVFPGAPKGWLVPGDPGLPGGGPIPSTLAPTTWKNFAPRLGLAWSPNASDGILGKLFGGPGKTSIRAAAGIYYTAIQDAGLFIEVADAPFGLFWVSQSPVLFDQPFLHPGRRHFADAALPVQSCRCRARRTSRIWTGPCSCRSPVRPDISRATSFPTREHYNFSIQRELSSSTVLTLAYVGTEGHKLFAQYEANPGNAALCLSLRGTGVAKGDDRSAARIRRTRRSSGPTAARSSARAARWDSTSAATPTNPPTPIPRTTRCRRPSSGARRNLTLLAAYTFSKSMDNASGFNTMNFSNFHLSRSLSSFDATHNFVLSYYYASALRSRIAGAPKRLTQGWSLNGITRFATGFPIAISQSGDRSLTGAGGVDHPDFIGGLVITPDVRDTPEPHYFNKTRVHFGGARAPWGTPTRASSTARASTIRRRRCRRIPAAGEHVGAVPRRVLQCVRARAVQQS